MARKVYVKGDAVRSLGSLGVLALMIATAYVIWRVWCAFT